MSTPTTPTVDLDGYPITTLDGEKTTFGALAGGKAALDGEKTTFGALAGGKAALVVNVASRCGLTPQYEQLEQLHERYGDRGFTVIGFPSNQFKQELDSEDAIQEYCSSTWGITFPMSARIELEGSNADPIYRELTQVPTQEDGTTGPITWNFEKFVIDANGHVTRFSPRTTPDEPQVIAAIEAALPAADAADRS